MIMERDRALKSGEVLGDYQILSLIGEGGMGEVYLAEDKSLGRSVAIKVLKFGLGATNFVRRFHQEERILAGLTHPNIAQLYGGGVTASGLPYFVMEYVDGTRLDDYCRRNDLSIPRRLALFQKICSAVSYAHQRLVIHRDIKAANIRVNAQGEPKLLDFGIAKLLDPATTTEPEPTMTFAAVMTPQYASPEQVRGENITTASDVYSLGVVLYELLTGRKPYQVDKRAPGALARAIAEQEPEKPSSAVARDSKSKNRNSADPQSTNPDPPFTIHDSRFTGSNPRVLRGDLDNIVLKALRKEPERRYASVEQFSDDIQRHLEGRPVLARKDTVGYRASKFVRRNKIAVAATVLILLAIIGGSITALWEANNARQQRTVAEREKLKAERVNAFLQDMLGAAAPEAKGIDVKVVDVLAEASRRARSELAKQPDVMASVLMTLGHTYISLGQYGPAVADLRSALDASLKANGELNATTATTMGWLGLALVFQDKAGEGEAISAKAVQLQRRLHPEGSAELGIASYGLGLSLLAKGDAKSAEPHLQEAAELVGRFLGQKHGYYVAALTSLAGAHEALGDPDEAERLYRHAIDIGRTVEPRYRIFLAQATSYFGLLLTRQQKYDEAESVLKESESIYREVLGDSNSSVPSVEADLAWLYFLEGDYPRAETEYRKALELLPKFFRPEHSSVLATETNFGLTLTRLDKAAEGEPYLRKALAIRRKTRPPGDPLIASAESALGECLTAQQRYSEAESLLLHSYAIQKSTLPASDPHLLETRQRLSDLYERWEKPEQAAAYR
ncbi:MAG: protein kinase domain-containing protein [Chthoniobacterales bacterium]